MYYCVFREESTPTLLAIYESPIDALIHKELQEYEETLKTQLCMLEKGYYNTASFYITTVEKPEPYIQTETETDTDSSITILKTRKQIIDNLYAPRIKMAQDAKNDRDAAEALTKTNQQEKTLRTQRQEILHFMDQWDTSDPDTKDSRLKQIKPTIRSYLLNNNDRVVEDWMRDRYIL